MSRLPPSYDRVYAQSGYKSLKAKNEARLAHDKAHEDRKKNILVLISAYLSENGYLDAAQSLNRESGTMINQYSVADNIDLYGILQDYEQYFDARFNKKPKIVRKLDSGHNTATSRMAKVSRPFSASTYEGVRNDDRLNLTKPNLPPSMARLADTAIVRDSSPMRPNPKTVKAAPSRHAVHKPSDTVIPTSNSTDTDNNSLDLTVASTPVPVALKRGKSGASQTSLDAEETPNELYEAPLLKPIPEAVFAGEFRDLAANIQRDIVMNNPEVEWSDVAGLEDAKRVLKEAVVMPIKYPQLFKGILTPWKGLLLFGPPGTGKTLLAKALATQCRTTFFNISASSIVSKWRGDSEKLVRVLFELARYHSPSTIFIDEIDALMSSRDSEQEHEGSRRLKTELLIQMDGLMKSDDLVFVLAVSNMPWCLDLAFLRRLEKRIFVPLPNMDAILAMLKHHLTPDRTTRELNETLHILSKKLVGYSGDDIRLVCKEAAMMPVRRLMELLEREKPVPVNPETGELLLERVTLDDFSKAISCTRPSTKDDSEDKYREWVEKFGNT